MKPVLETFVMGAVVALLVGGCGGGQSSSSSPSDAKVTAAISASASELEPDAGIADPVPMFMGILQQLRQTPQLAPLFDAYQVPNPMVTDDDALAQGLMDLLHSVKITISSGTLTVTNRETGAVIYSAPVSDLMSGMFEPGGMPGGTTTCTYAYSAWGDCQPDGTQTRAVVSATPAGCMGMPVLSQACTYAPPPAGTCTSFTYSAWSACQPDGTQTRTVVSASPAGCTGGSPVLMQACTYTQPLDGAALYTQYCSRCHGALATSSLKGKNISVSMIQSMGMMQGLTTDQLQAIVTAVGP